MPQATFQRDKSFILSAAEMLLVFQASIETHGLRVSVEAKLHKTMS